MWKSRKTRERLQREDLAAKIEKLLNDPNARRITRPGWETANYYVDPEAINVTRYGATTQALAIRPTFRERLRRYFVLAR